jgi:hypothetical protein
MVDVAPEFESRDNIGTTSQFTSTVGTSPVSIPSVAGGRISEVFIHNPASNPKNSILYFSMDGGTTFTSLPWNSTFGWTPKGSVTQIQIKADAAGRNYEIVMNREAT